MQVQALVARGGGAIRWLGSGGVTELRSCGRSAVVV